MSELKAVAALTQILGIVQNYLPPDSGMTADDALGQIIAVVDPWPLDGEPQLPVIPVGWEGSWRWMRHPTWNYGEPIPVQVWREASTGVVYYRPFDCRAQDFEWELRNSDWEEIAPAPQSPAVDGATLAGLVSAVGHLSALVDQMRALLVEVEDVCGHDDHGFEFEDGESEIIDKVRAMLGATNAAPMMPAVGQKQPPDGRLYAAINNLLAYCGAEGSIHAGHPFVTETMDALSDIDGGVCSSSMATASSTDRVICKDEQISTAFNAWFESLPNGRKAVLIDDKWMLARAAFKAAHGITAKPQAQQAKATEGGAA